MKPGARAGLWGAFPLTPTFRCSLPSGLSLGKPRGLRRLTAVVGSLLGQRQAKGSAALETQKGTATLLGPGHRHSSHRPRGTTTAYSKSPSRYLPKAWRMTVLTAISGFTTQNCSVACGKEEAAEGEHAQTPPQAGLCPTLGTGRRGPTRVPKWTAVYRGRISKREPQPKAAAVGRPALGQEGQGSLRTLGAIRKVARDNRGAAHAKTQGRVDKCRAHALGRGRGRGL